MFWNRHWLLYIHIPMPMSNLSDDAIFIESPVGIIMYLLYFAKYVFLLVELPSIYDFIEYSFERWKQYLALILNKNDGELNTKLCVWNATSTTESYSWVYNLTLSVGI